MLLHCVCWAERGTATGPRYSPLLLWYLGEPPGWFGLRTQGTDRPCCTVPSKVQEDFLLIMCGSTCGYRERTREFPRGKEMDSICSGQDRGVYGC